jgi:hypothetical protein
MTKWMVTLNSNPERSMAVESGDDSGDEDGGGDGGGGDEVFQPCPHVFLANVILDNAPRPRAILDALYSILCCRPWLPRCQLWGWKMAVRNKNAVGGLLKRSVRWMLVQRPKHRH